MRCSRLENRYFTWMDRSAASSSTGWVFSEIKRRIVIGDLKPGTRLKIETLREVLGVGASPIREALSLLTSDRLVERLEQRGFRVAEADEDHFRDILRTRCWLEDRALRASLRNADAEWEETLVLCHHRLARAERMPDDNPFDPESWEALHKAFHQSLIAACGSPITLRYCSELYDLNVRYRYLAAASEAYRARNVSAEHQAILEAAIDRDEKQVCALLMQHYDRTGSYLLEGR